MDRIEEKYKVSVIIPVYKVEKYLEDAVKSVLNQSYSNIDIILVDDGSPDGCPQICDNLEKKYPNIRTIHKPNGGLSSARNAGVSVLNDETKYVLFLDSDDKLEENAIEGMVKKAVEKNADMVVPDRYTKVFESTGECKEALHFPEQMYIENPKEFATKVLMEQGRAWRASALLYSRNAICNSGATFPEGHIAEDITFNLQILSYAKKIVFYPYSTLLNLKRDESITTTFQPNFDKDIWYIDEQAQLFLEKADVDTKINRERVDALLCRNIVTYLFSIMSKRNGLSYQEKKKKAISLLNNPNARNVIRSKHALPYFESAKTRLAIKIVYLLLRMRQDNLVILMLSKI